MNTTSSDNGRVAPVTPVNRITPQGNGRVPQALQGVRRTAFHPVRFPHREHADSRKVPVRVLLAYYVGVVAIAVAAAMFFPIVRDSMVYLTPGGSTIGIEGVFTGGGSEPPAAARFLRLAERGLSTFVVTLGALLLVLPVAWIYMRTKRLRYDPSLVQSVIVLPIVVAGLLMVVKNSVAIAFGLVGIVAAVRFRNTLADPRDAVYVFLALAIGVAAGVQALDVALVTSVVFNSLILTLWHYNVGSIYGGIYGRTGVLAIGDSHLLLASKRSDRLPLCLHVRKRARRIKADGLLLIHTAKTKDARASVEDLIAHQAREWQLAEVLAREEGYTTLEYLLRLKRKGDPLELLTNIDEHGSPRIAAVEYVPLSPAKR